MTPARQEPKTVLCFGDSNTWGFNPDGSGRLPYATRWPNQLEHRLNRSIHRAPLAHGGRRLEFPHLADG